MRNCYHIGKEMFNYYYDKEISKTLDYVFEVFKIINRRIKMNSSIKRPEDLFAKIDVFSRAGKVFDEIPNEAIGLARKCWF